MILIKKLSFLKEKLILIDSLDGLEYIEDELFAILIEHLTVANKLKKDSAERRCLIYVLEMILRQKWSFANFRTLKTSKLIDFVWNLFEQIGLDIHFTTGKFLVI